MDENAPSPEELAAIRRLAANPSKVAITTTAKYDIMSAGLTRDDICDEVVAWIDAKRRVKKVTMRGEHVGQAAYELKPRINETLFYIKILPCDLGTFREHLLIVSAHPDH